MDPVIRYTTLPSHSRSLKGFLFHFSRRSIHFYHLSHSEIDDIEKVAVRSSLRLPKTKKCTIESRAMRSSKNLIRTLIHTVLVSHTVKTRIILRVLRIILVILPEHPSDTKVQGKGKEKVNEEQAAQVLLNLQTLMKKSPTNQFIFQRHTPALTEPSGHEESSSLYAKIGLTDSETESDDDVSPEINHEAQDEGQAGPNPGKQVEGQAGSNPGDVANSQPQPSHVVHDGPNLEHMDCEATNASTQQNPEQMDEGFIATAYPKVQENLKLMVEEQVILEEPASSIGTLSSLQHLAKDFSFGDQFFNDKPSDVENEKTNA
ncbi:hypothetical protein Tco_0704382 [Tanacetum coccineum]|uniref:Uncharacterized protein n=1 Tax=Tanacetum coccineum TaxID=301880 RepID=A0ABQ4Y2F3_9ASTR